MTSYTVTRSRCGTSSEMNSWRVWKLAIHPSACFAAFTDLAVDNGTITEALDVRWSKWSAIGRVATSPNCNARRILADSFIVYSLRTIFNVINVFVDVATLLALLQASNPVRFLCGKLNRPGITYRGPSVSHVPGGLRNYWRLRPKEKKWMWLLR